MLMKENGFSLLNKKKKAAEIYVVLLLFSERQMQPSSEQK